MSLARFALLLTFLLAPPTAAAQPADRPPGHLATRVFAAAPTPLTLAIEPGENSDENMALAARIAQEAPARKIAVQPQAQLALRFDTEVRTNVRAARQTFSREGGGLSDPDIAAPSPPDSRDQVANVASSCGAGVVGAAPPRQTEYGRCLRYVINATLDDRASGRRLWQGHVSYDDAVPDRTAMFVALAPILVEHIGRSVPVRAFRLD